MDLRGALTCGGELGGRRRNFDTGGRSLVLCGLRPGALKQGGRARFRKPESEFNCGKMADD